MTSCRPPLQAMVKGIVFFIPLIIFCHSCKEIEPEKGLYHLVDPFIGTAEHGHTFPGPTMPFGMVQLSPDTRLEGWDGCSGYHYTDTVVYGFSHTHLSGTGVGDLCDILLKPCIGEVYMNNGYRTSPSNGYASFFNKKTEQAEVGYYSMDLNEGIKVELTTTHRAGMHRYTFNRSDNAHVIIDLAHRDLLLDSDLEFVNDSVVRGSRRSKEWALDQQIFFQAEFSKPIVDFELKSDSVSTSPGVMKYLPTKAVLLFDMEPNEQLIVKVGISAVDADGASNNLHSEIDTWDFDAIRESARQAWDAELSKIRVNGKKKDEVIFYTALYHSMIAPNLASDIDGRYRKMIPAYHATELKDRSMQDRIGQLPQGENHYTVFSLWDTYRATHPLLTIIDEKRTNEFIRTMLRQYQDGGQLPVWELASNYTGCMIGYHAIPVITDAYFKGINDWDADLALKAMVHSATLPHLGIPSLQNKGFIPTEDEPESVSKTLEYAYDDHCIAQMARAMNETEIYHEFIQRAQNYKNLYNQRNGFLQARSNGGWYSPFVPEEVNFNYTEANGWQYSLSVPHDINGLMKLMGGPKALVSHLDSLFSTDSRTKGRNQVDITGLIGQYAHGNEPSHHMAYLYSYAGQPWKTQKYVQKILKTMYDDEPDGLAGNEDCGQMSAWYVLSAMGFYPVCPGSDQYVIGYPLFDEVEIDVATGATFAISSMPLAQKDDYIVSATLNGFPHQYSYLTHDDILAGGELEFDLDGEPDEEWGVGEDFEPSSSIGQDDHIIIIPSINTDSRTFEDSLKVEIHTPQKGVEIHYVLSTQENEHTPVPYSVPFFIDTTTIVTAWASINSTTTFSDQSQVSKRVNAHLKKIDGGRSIELLSKYETQYSAAGDKALIDNMRGGNDFRTGNWQGYRGDLEAIVDLGKLQAISTISLSCLQDIKSWIWMPRDVSFYISSDKKEWTEVERMARPEIHEDQYGSFTGAYSAELTSIETRFIKVVAKNYGVCPPWHLGAGGKAWLFVDELVVE